MRQWRLWVVIWLYGVLIGAMGGVLASRDPSVALLWVVTVAIMQVGATALMLWWWRRRAARHE